MKLERLVHGGGVQIAIRVGVDTVRSASRDAEHGEDGFSRLQNQNDESSCAPRSSPTKTSLCAFIPPLFARPRPSPRARVGGRAAAAAANVASISSAATGGVALAPTAECPRPENTVRLCAKILELPHVQQVRSHVAERRDERLKSRGRAVAQRR